ncbi:hypothetical protein Tco_0017148 [Tanacetum coccineum]
MINTPYPEKTNTIWYDEDIHDLRSVETKFSAIAFNDGVSSEKTLSCEPTVSSLNDEIDFRISFDDSDDEDYTVIDKNSFSYKIISVNNLKTDSENDNEKVNMPSFPPLEDTVSCFDDLDFFKDFENEFPAIVYNDAQTSKSDLLTEPILSPQHIDEFDLNDEISLSKYDEKEQKVLYFNDLFSFNIIHTDNLKSEKDNDDNEIDIIQSSGGKMNTQGLNMLLETSHDKINKAFKMGSFIMELNINIVTWNYLINGMLFYLIMNLYVPLGISFDPKRYYKDGVYTRTLWRPRSPLIPFKAMINIFVQVNGSKWVKRGMPFLFSNYRAIRHMALSPRDQRHQYLRYQGLEYTNADIIDFKERFGRIYSREIHWVQVMDFQGMPELMRDVLHARMLMEHRDDDGVVLFTS